MRKKARRPWDSSRTPVLGVLLDTSQSLDGTICVSNSDSRKREIANILDLILRDRELGKAAALQLRGRLGFAESQITGRTGTLLMNKLTGRAYGSSSKGVRLCRCCEGVF